ncbi:MAG: MBL fold metallo-hydrolase [Actinomycetota bacterium]
MASQQILPGLFGIGGGSVNAFLVTDGEAMLVDTLLPKRWGRLLDAIRGAGREPSDIRHIAITHYHLDHIGTLAQAVRITGANVYVGAEDAAVIRDGLDVPRPTVRGPVKVLAPLVMAMVPKSAEAAPVTRELQDRDELPVGGIRVIHTPGHTPGHVSYLWPAHGGVLFVGDAAADLLGRLSLPTSHEDLPTVKESLRKIAELEFEVAVFGHGSPIKGKAAVRFRRLVAKLAA